MNFHASLVDQQVTGFIGRHADLLPPAADEARRRSAAFTILCMMHYFQMSAEEAATMLTDGGQDVGVDGMHMSETKDKRFFVTLFQAKYKVRNLDGDAVFPESEVVKIIASLRALFDPYCEVTLNDKIRPKIEEARRRLADNHLPTVRVVLCNNGARWNADANRHIEEAKKDFPGQVEFLHFNHHSIIGIMRDDTPVDVTLHMKGRLIQEHLSNIRLIVGRVSVAEIAELMERFGDQLLQRNIRHYLGLAENPVNKAIQETLIGDMSEKFYFLNNGIAMVCENFAYNTFHKEDYDVRLTNLQVINGGQTCNTIHQTWKNIDAVYRTRDFGRFSYVLVRIYQLPIPHSEEDDAGEDLALAITRATNSQTPVILSDLRSNDRVQKTLEIGIQGLGYEYKRKRGNGVSGGKIIASTDVARAVLAIWRQKPHLAQTRKHAHFDADEMYDAIFEGLHPAQAILAVEILREAERRRGEQPPKFMHYAAFFAAMLMGRLLLKKCGIEAAALSHKNFAEALAIWQANRAEFYDAAVARLDSALKRLYGDREVSLQQLSVTFDRIDLLEMLQGDD